MPRASGIAKVADLKGKTLGKPVIHPDPYVEGIYKEAGLDLAKDAKVITTGTGAPAFVALKRGEIADWMSWDTAVADLENRGMEFTEFRPSYYGQLFGNAVVTREDVIRNNPNLVVGMCRAIAKAAHFGLANPEAAIRIHWNLYPQSKPQTNGEAKLLADSRRIFMSRFESYALTDVSKYGESRGDQWKYSANLLKEQGNLPADFDVGPAYTNEFIDEINNWDRSVVEAKAKAWAPS